MTTHVKDKAEQEGKRYHRAEVGRTGDTASQAQLFGPLSIYNYQQKSTRLAQDLSQSFFGKQKRDAFSALLVLRDGCTEDDSFKKCDYSRFYHPSFLARFTFLNKQLDGHCLRSLFEGTIDTAQVVNCARQWAHDSSCKGHQLVPLLHSILMRHKEEPNNPTVCKVWEWILLFSADPTVKLNPHITIQDGATDTSHWLTFVTQTEDEAAWQRWQRPHTAREAFERLVSAFSRLTYAGATPSGLDKRIFSTNQKRAFYPIVCITQSYRHPNESWIKGVWANLCNQSSRPVPLGRGGTVDSRLSIDPTTFPYDDDSRRTAVNELFFDFLDPFFMGSNEPRPKEGSGFHGLAFPLFDRWEYDRPVGAFVGWVFFHFGDKPADKKRRDKVFDRFLLGACRRAQSGSDKTCAADRVQRREILRANLNDYAESLAEYILAEEIARYDPTKNGDPKEYFRRRFHYIEGWKVESVNGGQLAANKYFWFETRERRLHVRLDGVCVVLIPKEDTILPLHGSGADEEYYERIAGWARLFWESLKRLSEQSDVGRAHAALTAYSKTAHQLRKLAWHIRAKTPTAELDALRHYFMVTFLSPKNVEALATFYGDVAIGVFGEHFMQGHRLNDFVRFAATDASVLYPLVCKLHNDSPQAPICNMPDIIYPANGNTRRMWDHDALLYAAQDENLSPPFKPEDVACTKAKAFLACALVALWLNIYEHTPEDGRVSVLFDEDQNVLEFRNTPKHSSTTDPFARRDERSGGTRETLEFYLSAIPGCNLLDRLYFPETTEDGVFVTRLPLPRDLLYA